MKTSEIKAALENGENFGNDAAGWYTVNKAHENTRCIVFVEGHYKRSMRGDSYTFCKDYSSMAKRVFQLMARGY